MFFHQNYFLIFLFSLYILNVALLSHAKTQLHYHRFSTEYITSWMSLCTSFNFCIQVKKLTVVECWFICSLQLTKGLQCLKLQADFQVNISSISLRFLIFNCEILTIRFYDVGSRIFNTFLWCRFSCLGFGILNVCNFSTL